MAGVVPLEPLALQDSLVAFELRFSEVRNSAHAQLESALGLELEFL